MQVKKPKMAIAVVHAQTLSTLAKGQVAFWKQHAFDVDVFAAKDSGVESILEEGANFFNVEFTRKFSLYHDIVSLWQLSKLLSRRKPDIIQLMTSKPSFLGSIAARLKGVPVIVRHKQGNVHDCDLPLLKRWIFFPADKLSNRLAHRVVVVSHKLAESEIRAGAINPDKVVVYGSGSSNGLDLERFKLTSERKKKGMQIRRSLGIGDDWQVLGTVMRVNIDKGICELVEAYLKLSDRLPNLALIIAGGYDTVCPPPENVIRTIKEHPRIYSVGFQKNVEDYYAAMDVFVMPSYREGFCKSNIEAGGMEIPVIATDIIGCNELVIDGVSGLLVPPRDSAALAKAMEKILTDAELARRLVRNVRKQIEREFDQKFVWHNQLRDFCSLLKSKDIVPPIEPNEINRISCPLCIK